MENGWEAPLDEDMPGRSMRYLMKHGMSRRDAAAAVAREFELDDRRYKVMLVA